MDQQSPPFDPLPPRLARFAVWRWSWRRLALLAVVAYLLSPVPVLCTLEKFAPALSELAERTVYLPVAWAHHSFRPVRSFYNVQENWFREAYGL